MSEFSSDKESAKASGTFLNYGENVLYGSDYDAMIVLPGSDTTSEYRVEVRRLLSTGSGNEGGETVFEQELTPDQMLEGGNYTFERDREGVDITMELMDGGTRFGVVSVPNSGFENARFRILVYDSDDNIIGRKTVNSRWLDMPVSLLNIDVAIDMMRFIVSDDQLDRLERGSASEKERKFREYWDQRDPTPDTEFNELMTEYYERIDYAYRNFSSPQRPGFESDQGQAYILYGQPDNIERRLPADQPTREIWEYPNRTLIFEATSGFGDFVLISEQQAQ
jgi:GWxTD domain-containing protein